jgi:formyl-CoA transferase
MCDQLSGVYSAYGILGALVHRMRTGEGQLLETSMLGVAMAFQASPVALALLEDAVNDKWSRATRSQTYAFIASDGLPLAIHLSTPDKFWRGLANAVERPDLIDDERFAAKSGRIVHYQQLHGELRPIFATQPRRHWMTILQDADVPVAAINTVKEALSDDQVRELGIVQEYGASGEQLPLVGSPIRYRRTPSESRGGPPAVGEHTEAVLAEAGVSADEIEQLRHAAVI